MYEINISGSKKETAFFKDYYDFIGPTCVTISYACVCSV